MNTNILIPLILIIFSPNGHAQTPDEPESITVNDLAISSNGKQISMQTIVRELSRFQELDTQQTYEAISNNGVRLVTLPVFKPGTMPDVLADLMTLANEKSIPLNPDNIFETEIPGPLINSNEAAQLIYGFDKRFKFSENLAGGLFLASNKDMYLLNGDRIERPYSQDDLIVVRKPFSKSVLLHEYSHYLLDKYSRDVDYQSNQDEDVVYPTDKKILEAIKMINLKTSELEIFNNPTTPPGPQQLARAARIIDYELGILQMLAEATISASVEEMIISALLIENSKVFGLTNKLDIQANLLYFEKNLAKTLHFKRDEITKGLSLCVNILIEQDFPRFTGANKQDLNELRQKVMESFLLFPSKIYAEDEKNLFDDLMVWRKEHEDEIFKLMEKPKH